MDLSSKERWLPPAIMVTVAAGVAAYLYFIFGYSSGYNFERYSIWDNMRLGYRMEDAEWAFG
ncbi:MAG: hypothetical protein HKN82_18165, partial [Akkermansiaceae bacterium]|nr:hypothetical protein [Akkermansiaceae bacterium]